MVDERVLESLSVQIDLKRKEMIEMANIKGFTHIETIQISQELDSLINEYQRLTKEKSPFQYVCNNVKSWSISESFMIQRSGTRESMLA